MRLRSGFEHLRLCSDFCLLHPGAPALRRLDFGCVCARRVPVASAVGAVLPYLCLVPSRHSVRCDILVRCMYSGLVGGLVFAARAALLAYVGGLAFLIRVCLR